MKNISPQKIAVLAVLTAVVTVFTLAVRVPIPATQGYINFSDVAIYFAAFTFGPWVCLVAGGLGAALADVYGGYASFAPLTFLAHGLEGLAAGYLAAQSSDLRRLLLAWAAGTLVMAGVYFLGETTIMGMGLAAAAAELPFNLAQNLAGALLGIPLFYAVRRAYPQASQLGLGKSWTELN